MDPPGTTADTDIGETLAIVGMNGWRCLVCSATFPRAFSIEHHMITTHSTPQSVPSSPPVHSIITGQKSESGGTDAATGSVHQPEKASAHSADIGALQVASVSVSSEGFPQSFTEGAQAAVTVPYVKPASSQLNDSLQTHSGGPAAEIYPVVSEAEPLTKSQPEDMEGIEARFDSMCVTKKQGVDASNQNQQDLHSRQCENAVQEEHSTEKVAKLQKPHKEKVQKRICGCGKLFDTKHELKQHHKTSSCKVKQKVFVCPVCGEGFAYKRGLNRHLEAKGGAVAACTDCHRRFHSQLALQSHRAEAHGAGFTGETSGCLSSSSPPTSQECEQNAGQPVRTDDRREGDVQHERQKDVCEEHAKCQALDHPRIASTHWLIDSGSHCHTAAPWECPKCQKRFFRKGVYRNHLLQCGILKIEQGHRSFHCPLCDKVFRWLVVLHRHYLNHHKTHSAFSGGESPVQLSPFSGNSPAPSANTSTTTEDVDMILSDADDSVDSNAVETIDGDTSSVIFPGQTEKGKDPGVDSASRVADSENEKRIKTEIYTKADQKHVDPQESATGNKQQDDKEDVIVVSDVEDDSDSDLDSDIEWVSMPESRTNSKEKNGGEKTEQQNSQTSSGFDQGAAECMFGGFPPWRFLGMRGMRGHGPHFPPPPPPPHPFHHPPPCHAPPPPPPPPHHHHSPPPPYDAGTGDQSHGDAHDWQNFYDFHHFPGHHRKRRWCRLMLGLYAGHGFPPHGPPFHGWHRRHSPFHRHARGPAGSEFDTSVTKEAKMSSAATHAPSSCTTQGGRAEISTQQGSASDKESHHPKESETLGDNRAVGGDGRTDISEQEKRIGQAIGLIMSSMEDGTKIWYCPDCLQAFQNKKCLKRHHEEKHTSLIFPCPLCEEHVPSPVQFNKHVRRQHTSKRHGHSGWSHRHWHHMHRMAERGWSSDNHNRMFTDPHFAESVAAGLADDSDGEGLKECPICKKTFRAGSRKQSFFERHVNSHFGIDTFNFKCEECGKTFLEKSKFVSHQAKHCSAEQFVCSTCGKSYQNKTSLTRHERIHTGERPHRCPDCGEGFFEHRELVRHQATHTGQAAFQCPECGAGFTLRSSLVTHMRYKHTGEKPFTCSSCHKGFSASSALGRHRRICPAAGGDSAVGRDGDNKDDLDEGDDKGVEILSTLKEKPETVACDSPTVSLGRVKEEPSSMET